MGQLIVRF